MSNEFIIKTPSGPILKFTKDSEYEVEGWGSFIVSLSNAPVTGVVRVSDLEPKRWKSYFIEMAKDWKGWKGSRDIESIEGDLSLSATTDSVGHIYIRVELKASPGDEDWHVAGTLMIEAGSLDSMAKSASKFFNYIVYDNKRLE
jgi:hypothetical protein